ncbi:hypothetical protein LOK46_32550 (plasmid) [Methylobacterium sp. NMS14P]|uniref:hypothetical protein n=1 Tax=Methylobacterium sp. NMS14P TaxID=2894310 RepID=UPI002358E818|nr:hypothetical protein [Methylobacterium sp. NMS14P]WCS28922.1 hypothetical protein LOK46_32550 [Methylobacterium sp. NMS14P]
MAMSTGPHRDDATSFDAIQALREALAGAFAEKVDLGPRAEQIRQLGRSLEMMIEALRIRLVELGAEVQTDGQPLRLEQLTRMARAVRADGLEEKGVCFDHGPIKSLSR